MGSFGQTCMTVLNRDLLTNSSLYSWQLLTPHAGWHSGKTRNWKLHHPPGPRCRGCDMEILSLSGEPRRVLWSWKKLLLGQQWGWQGREPWLSRSELLYRFWKSCCRCCWPFGVGRTRRPLYWAEGISIHTVQRWALSVFFNFFNNKKWFFAFFIKLIWLGVGFLNRIGAEICYYNLTKNAKTNFFKNKFKKNRKCPALYIHFSQLAAGGTDTP